MPHGELSVSEAVKTEQNLQERAKALAEEWGEEVAGRKAD